MNRLEEPIAIVAAACQLPGGKDLASFWEMVCQGKTGIGPIPEARFNRRLFFDPKPGTLNKTYTDLAALVDYQSIDWSAVPLPPHAEEEYDIAHLAFAATVVDACRMSGLDPSHFPIQNTGVFVGHTRPGTISQGWSYRMTLPETISCLENVPSFTGAISDRQVFYRTLQDRASAGFPEIPPGSRPLYLSSDITQLVSRMLHIDGPGMVFNSACASSLHAVAQAILALRHGRIDAAFAGGSTFFHSDTLLLFASSRSMTKNRSCPFDREADGLVIGEGNVVLLLKRLSDALVAGDSVMAVLTGVGIASDGKGKSLWAPRKEGQIEAIRKAYAKCDDLSQVDYIEAHATSTALGDATEIDALLTVFGPALTGRRIPLGSAKGNVGHTLEVAGATGILKAAMTLSTGIVPPVGGLRHLNPKVSWEKIPFYAPMQSEKLANTSDGRPRRAAVNSFGIGGLNVHLVLDEYIPDYWRNRISSRAVHSTADFSPSPKKSSCRHHEPIAVVGCGCILPDAYSFEDFRRFLDSGKSAFRSLPRKSWDLDLFRRNYTGRSYKDVPPFVAGVIDHYQYDWKKNKVPPKQVENASPIQFMMLDAVNEALSDFGFMDDQTRHRTGVVVGSGFGGDFSNKMNAMLALPAFNEHLRALLIESGISDDTIETILNEYSGTLHRHMPALLDETGSFTPSALASRITKTLDLSGGAVAVESETGSFGAALMCCADQLESDCNDLMIAIGGQQDLGPGVFDLLTAEGLLTDHPDRSPFDADATGYAPGEGCGVLLLKRLDRALRDGNRIKAVIDGIGGSAGPSIYANFHKSAQRAEQNNKSSVPTLMELPLLAAESDADYLDAASTLANESDHRPIQIRTITSRIGQFGAGSSAASCLKAILELTQGVPYPEAGLKNTDPFYQRFQDILDPEGAVLNEKQEEAVVVTGKQNIYYIKFRLQK